VMHTGEELPPVRYDDRKLAANRRNTSRERKSRLRRRESDERWSSGTDRREGRYKDSRPVTTDRRTHTDNAHRSGQINKPHRKSDSGWFAGPASVFGIGKRVGETELHGDLPASSDRTDNRRTHRSDRHPDRSNHSGGKDRGFAGVKPSWRRDDLTRINGISPSMSKQLYALHITSFSQISSLSDEQINQLQDEHFFECDIRRQNWVSQARRLTKTKA